MNVLSLFDGMSCGQIALERARIKVDTYFASEIDKAAIKVTQHNYPNTVQLGSCIEVKGNELPKIDLLIGGSPCQGFSFSGKQLNFNDPRSKLFFEYVRVLKETNPAWFLLENVKMAKEHEIVITRHLKVRPLRFNSKWVSAQYRERLYWTNIPVNTIPENLRIQLGSVLEFDFDKLIKYKASDKRKKILLAGKFNQEKVMTRDQRSITLMAGHGMGGTKPWLNCEIIKDIRALTEIECERLQCVPDNYTNVGLSRNNRYKMLGNGWTVDIIAHILKHI